jgi:O-antigen/teichoic acid export membrane protein
VAFYVARGSDAKRTQRRALTFAAATSVITYGLLIAYSGSVSEAQGIPVWLLAILWFSVIPGALIAIRRSVWSGNLRWKRLDFERATFAVSRLLVICLLAAIGLASVGWFAAGPLIAGLMISAVVLFRPIGNPVEGLPERYPTRRQFVYFSLNTALGTIAAAASARLGAALMPALTSSEQIGLYAVAVTVAEIPLVIGAVLSRNLVSEVAAGVGKRRLLSQVLLGAAAAAAAVTVLAVMSGWAVPTFFGEGFADSVPVIWILLGATWVSVLSMSISSIITGLHKPLAASIPQLAAILVVVTGFVLRGDNITAIEVAWITLFAQCAAGVIALVVLTYMVRKGRGAD